jgi:hypothetical protein
MFDVSLNVRVLNKEIKPDFFFFVDSIWRSQFEFSRTLIVGIELNLNFWEPIWHYEVVYDLMGHPEVANTGGVVRGSSTRHVGFPCH